MSVLTALLGVACSLIPYFIIIRLITALVNGTAELPRCLTLCAWMAGCWVLRYVLHSVSTSLSHHATFHVLANTRVRLLDKLATLPLGTVLDRSSGSYKNIIVERVDSIETTLAHLLPEMTTNIVGALAVLVLLFIEDWRMGLSMFIVLPLGILCFMSMFSGYNEKFQRTVTSTKALNDTAVEYINGIEVHNTGSVCHKNEIVRIPDEVAATLKPGRNIIAAECTNPVANGLLDFGILMQKDLHTSLEQTAVQTSVDVQATQTYYKFDCGPVSLGLTFTAPLLMDDLHLLSRPVNYISYKVTSTDGKKHNVRLYFEASPRWALDQPYQASSSETFTDGDLVFLKSGSKEQDILAKKGVAGIDSNLATAIRTSFVFLLLWAIVLLSGMERQMKALTRENLFFLLLSGMATGLSWLFYFKALQSGDVSRVAPIDKLSVALVILFGILFLHESVRWNVLAGGALIVLGSLLLLIEH